MKSRLLILLFSLFFLNGCVFDNMFIEKTKKRAAHTNKTISTVKTNEIILDDSIISTDNAGALVSASWLKRYKELEKKHGTIPEDDLITAEGENFRINQAVADHFIDMKSGVVKK